MSKTRDKHNAVDLRCIAVLAVVALVLAGCDAARTSPDDECPIYRPTMLEVRTSARSEVQTIQAEWHDLGLIAGARSATDLVVAGDQVLVATDDGIWRRSIDESGSWARSGLEGHQVLALETMTGRKDLVFAGIAIPDTAEAMSAGSPDDAAVPFYRSEDGGLTWTGYGEGLFDEERGLYDPVAYIASRPGSDGETLYAGLGGSSIARSTNGGQSWTFVSGGPGGFGYPCPIHIPADDSGTLFQGCEAPLDFAWIRAYDVGRSQQADLGEGCLVADHDEISNRRPNLITSFDYSPGLVFAGLEGALVGIRDGGWDWIWRREESGAETPYTYVKFVWINPDDPMHIVFGGGDGTDPMRGGLYETFNGGADVTPLEGPDAVDFTDWGVFAGSPVNDGQDFLVVHVSNEGARVLMRTHAVVEVLAH